MKSYSISMNNNNNNKNLVVPLVVSLGSAATAYAVYHFYCYQRTKQAQQKHAIISKPLNDDSRSTAVSYIHLKVTDLEKSKRFYLDFGLVEVVDDENSSSKNETSKSMILLQVPSSAGSSKQPQQQPYLLLQHDKQRVTQSGNNARHTAAAAAATAAGYGRMCLLVQDCQKEVQRLAKNFGYKPIAPAVTDRPGTKDKNNKNGLVTIVAYIDPDDNMVELVSISSGIQTFLFKTLQWMGIIKFPLWVHVNINATNYKTSYTAYQTLGMIMHTDYGMVNNSLYQALGIAYPGIAQQVSLLNFPKQFFMLDLIQWQNPKTVRLQTTTSTSSMRLAIAVDDVALMLDKLLAAPLSDNDDDNKDTTRSSSLSLWSLESTPVCVDLPPPLHRAIQCTIADPDGTLVDLVSFPQKSILMPENVKLLVSDGNGDSKANNKTKKNKNKAILVTGCDTGFGRSVAIQMTGLGFQVIAVCFTQDGANFIESIAALTIVADLTTERGLKDVVDAVHSMVGDKDVEHGHYDENNTAARTELWAIVNNAGMHCPGHVEWTSPQAYKHVMELNFHAPVYLIHEFLSLLRQSKGRIVNVTSVCGIVASPSNSTYCSSKFALEALSDSLRVENKPFGVNVIIVEPTTMDTPLAMNWFKDWDKHYKNADPNKKRMHSDAWAKGFVERGGAMLKAVAEDPRITVGEIVNALVMKDPPARILSGIGARGYYELSRLGESERDAVFYSGPDTTD